MRHTGGLMVGACPYRDTQTRYPVLSAVLSVPFS